MDFKIFFSKEKPFLINTSGKQILCELPQNKSQRYLCISFKIQVAYKIV